MSAIGARLRMALPSDKTRTRALVVTELTRAIALRSTGRTLWSSSAMTAEVEGTRAGDPDTVARKLADTLTRRFPARRNGPIPGPWACQPAFIRPPA